MEPDESTIKYILVIALRFSIKIMENGQELELVWMMMIYF